MISDYRTSKVLAVNKIELGMPIPTIESRASKISRDEGNINTESIESWHCDSSDMIIVECVGVNMDFQIPLLIIDGDHVRVFSNSSCHTLNANQR
jgi:hypothetical protein